MAIKDLFKKKAVLRNPTQIFVWIFHWSALKLSAYSAGDTDTPYLDTILDTRDNHLLPRLHNTFEGLFTVRARTLKDLTDGIHDAVPPSLTHTMSSGMKI